MSQDEHAAVPRQGALRRRPGGRGDRPRRGDRGRGARPDRGRVRDRSATRATPSRGLGQPGAAHPRLRRGRQRPQARARSSSATSRRRSRDADRVFEDVFFFQGNTHLPIEQHASLAAMDPDGKLTIWSRTQTPHYLHRALAKALEMPAAHIRVDRHARTAAASAARATRSTTRSSSRRPRWSSDRPVKICLTREEVFYCHRGRHPVLMRFKTGVKNDGTITGDASRRRCSTAARTARYGVAQHVLHRRAADGHLPHPDATASTAAGCSRTSRRAARSAGTARRSRASARRSSSTRSPRRSASIRPSCACRSSSRRTRSPRTACASARSASPSASTASSPAPAGTNKFRKLPRGRGVGLACSSYLSGAGLPIYWNDMPALGRAAQARPQRRRHGLLRRDRDRPGLGRRARRLRRGGAGHRPVRHPRRHRRHRPDAGRPRLATRAASP